MRSLLAFIASTALILSGSACSAPAGIATPASSKGGTVPVAPPFAVRRVATLDNPVSIAFLPDGRMLVTEKPGALRLVTQQGRVSPPIAGVPKVDYGGQGGLLDVALSPEFAQDRFVYLSYSEPGKGGSSLALARAVFATDARSLTKLQVIWRQEPKGDGGQFGGAITFSPDPPISISLLGRAPAQDARAGPATRRSARSSGSRPPVACRATIPIMAMVRCAPRHGRAGTAIPTASPSIPPAGCGKSRWGRWGATSST